MIRKYKAFGLALMALVAFGAIAQSASAIPLTVGVPEVHITGEQEPEGVHVFTASGGEVRCTTSKSDSTAKATEGKINEITVAPTYAGCKAFGFATAHVFPNGCTYTLTTGTALKAGEVTFGTEQAHVVCPTGKSIEITPTSFGVSVCTQSIGSQTPTKGHVVGRNAGGAKAGEMDLTLENTLEGIHYIGTGSVCGNGETHIDAKFTGNTTAICYSDAAHTVKVDCTFS